MDAGSSGSGAPSRFTRRVRPAKRQQRQQRQQWQQRQQRQQRQRRAIYPLRLSTTQKALQPVSAWHSPGQFGVGAGQGPARGPFHLRPSYREVARITASDSDGAAANAAVQRL